MAAKIFQAEMCDSSFQTSKYGLLGTTPKNKVSLLPDWVLRTTPTTPHHTNLGHGLF